MSTESIQTLDQRRAAHAWKVASEVEGWNDGRAKKDFGTQTKKMPTRILSAGLGQSLAFLEAKKAAPELLNALAYWINVRRPAPAGRERLVVRVIEGDADFLRFATAECLAYLQWLVRFADALGLTEGGQE